MADQGDVPDKVLNYWHKVEFFESASIDELEEGASGVIHFNQEMLAGIPDCFPWLNRQNVTRAGPGFSPSAEYDYIFYLGIFSRREIFARAHTLFPEAGNSEAERCDDEGRSCSIKLHVCRDGSIDLARAEFSTVPWALGQLQAGGLERITWQEYAQATERLRDTFLRIVTVADNLKQEHGLPPVLTTYEVVEFLKGMADWTDFSPEPDVSMPALIVQVIELPPRNEHPVLGAVDPGRLPLLSTLPSRLGADIHPAPGESRRQTTPPGEINILNSFYIQDIERVAAQIARGGLPPDSPLGRYLSLRNDKLPDLLTPAGRSLLLEHLQMARLPIGRWPGNDDESMSLMQQFAINVIEDKLANAGLYSVNGPPGTGKTTMLRDLVASNLVKRAEVLARLSRAADAFGPDLKTNIDQTGVSIKRLIPSLTGFEMVVVSNNNAAVENISQELPQRRHLGPAYRDVAYLKPVAQKLAARHTTRMVGKMKKTVVAPLAEQDDCWGLIAAALGKYANRSMFGERVVYKPIEQCETVAPADQYRTLMAEIKQLADSGDCALQFRQAQADFETARQKVRHIVAALQILEAAASAAARFDALSQEIQCQEMRLPQLAARVARALACKPGFWSGGLRRWCRWRAIHAGLERRKVETGVALKKNRDRLQKLHAALVAARQASAPLQDKYGRDLFPCHDTDLELPAIQRKAFGLCPALNRARAELTIKALALHQAWLVDAYKHAGLARTLFYLARAIDGKVPDPEAARAIWQILFMIVPVVSSTFASVARQFGVFGAGDIGWLFIDEAGQATPQQAVGALWRAKRAVVVGDPLQVEPVFSIPSAFVEGFARAEFGDDWGLWSPSINSVQKLADRVNPYGTRQVVEDQWLGSPLRVHRRCLEPMFGIANAIAYNNKMLHGADKPFGNDAEFVWKHSNWFDIDGAVAGKHFVPAQADFVVGMVQDYIRQHERLPDVYIISPFKKVKAGLVAALREVIGKRRFAGTDVDRWIRERVGTIHTFQGKEEENVILVLGLDQQNPGAAKWAAAKPNLLNVAVTRAKKRFYIVGSKAVWSNCQYFSQASDLLEKHKRTALNGGRLA